MKKYNLSILLFNLILFFSIFLLGMDRLGYWFEPQTTLDLTYKDFYEQAENIDLLILGSSHSYRSFIPDIIEKERQLNTFILSSGAQTLKESYYTMKNALVYSKPEMIVMETFFIDQVDNLEGREPLLYDNIQNFEAPWIKLEAYLALVEPLDYFNGAFSGILYHDKWQDLESIKSNIRNKKYRDKHHLASYDDGYIRVESVLSEENREKLSLLKDNYTFELGSENKAYLDKIIELAQTKDIEIVFVNAPIPNVIKESGQVEKRYELSKSFFDSRDVVYIDYNMKAGMFTDDDFSNEYSEINNIHLNHQGAIKLSEDFLSYLPQGNYEWQGNYFLDDFLENIQENQLVILSVKDEASQNLDRDNVTSFDLDTLSQLSFRESYLGILEKDKVILERKSLDALKEVYQDKIEILSSGFDAGNQSSIMMNDKEYSLNQRGINVLVLNKESFEVIEIINFDTFTGPMWE